MIQREALSEELLAIIRDTIRKIQFIDERVLPREF